jgi:hypothetical protein
MAQSATPGNAAAQFGKGCFGRVADGLARRLLRAPTFEGPNDPDTGELGVDFGL